MSAEEGRLPADTEVRVYYGGSGLDTYRLDELPSPRILFCTPVEADAPSAGGAAGAASLPAAAGQGDDAGSGGVDGAAGEPGAEGSDVSRLECELWSEGPACIEVESGEERLIAEELVLEPDICTVSARVELPLGGEGDSGLSRCRDD